MDIIETVCSGIYQQINDPEKSTSYQHIAESRINKKTSKQTKILQHNSVSDAFLV